MKEFVGYKRGVNLGGWLSQCEYSEAHYSSFISEADIRRISEWGLDHVRVPIDYELVRDEKGCDIESGYAHINDCIGWCEKHKLNMILDLHKTAGFSFDEEENSFFDRAELQEEFVLLWEELARRYGKYSDRLSFELLNEVVDIRAADLWNEISARAISAIRKIAPDVKIIVGGVRNNSVLWVNKLDKPIDENIVYTFHYYEPLIFTHQSAYWINTMDRDFHIGYPQNRNEIIAKTQKYLMPEHQEIFDVIHAENCDIEYIREAFSLAVRVADERNVPLYCGEYGVIDQADLMSTKNWYADMVKAFEEFGIGHAAWNYKGKDFGLIDEHYSGISGNIADLI